MRLLLFILLLLAGIIVDAQHYTYIEDIKTGIIFPNNISLRDIHHVFYKDDVFVIRAIKDQNEQSLIIYRVEISTGKTLDTYRVEKLPNHFMVKDLAVTNKHFAVIGSDSYVYFEPQSDDYSQSLHYYPYNDEIFFDRGVVLNDSMIVLYKLYNFHPNDAKPGLHIHILNLHTNTIEKSRFIPYPSILLSHMEISWVDIIDREIVCIAPLTGKMIKINAELSEIRIDSALTNQLQLTENIKHERYFDSLFLIENQRLNNIIESNKTNGRNLNLQSKLYSKDGIWDVIQKVRNNIVFIEKYFLLNDSTICISVSKPGYGGNYRDVYFFNVMTNNITKQFLKWKIYSTDSLRTFEDFFTINLLNPSTNYPYFYKNFVYSRTLYNPKLFKEGSKDVLSETLLKDVMEGGYNVRILKYKLNH